MGLPSKMQLNYNYCAEVKVPPFTKGKPQLSKHEVDTTHELAHVRIHVK